MNSDFRAMGRKHRTIRGLTAERILLPSIIPVTFLNRLSLDVLQRLTLLGGIRRWDDELGSRVLGTTEPFQRQRGLP